VGTARCRCAVLGRECSGRVDHHPPTSPARSTRSALLATLVAYVLATGLGTLVLVLTVRASGWSTVDSARYDTNGFAVVIGVFFVGPAVALAVLAFLVDRRR
jgi:hypothetical protein